MGDLDQRSAAWTPEEEGTIARMLAGDPGPPAPELRYVLADCFRCGAVHVRRWWAGDGRTPAKRSCPSCSIMLQPVVVGQLPRGSSC